MSQPNSAAAPPRNSGAINLFRVTVPICAVVAVGGIIFPEKMADGATAVTRAAFGALDRFFMAATAVFLAWLGLAVFRRPKRQWAGATAK